jgi:chemotaxis receptor (MCP) glutamine deamidase CheD
MVAKVFGGSEVMQGSGGMFRIGEKNADIAFQALKKEGIPVIGHSTGADKGRRILFRTATGEVLMRYVKRTQIQQPHRKNLSKSGLQAKGWKI